VIANPAAHETPSVARAYVAPDGTGTAHGTAGADDIYATGAGQTLIGGGGHDVFNIGNHTDAKIVVGGGGTTTVASWAGEYKLAAGVDNLTVLGDYAHAVSGNGRANFITGSNGNDTIEGGGGDVTIVLGTGANRVTGGGQHDLFVFEKAASHDNVVTDFHAGRDMLDLRGMLKDAGYAGSDPVADHVLQIAQHGADTTIALAANGGAHNVVTLQNVTASSLHAGHDYLWH
jgi:Ca2+-binding RTX toxin-like protein